MEVRVVVELEYEDPQHLQDFIEALERISPYFFNNVVVRSEVSE